MNSSLLLKASHKFAKHFSKESPTKEKSYINTFNESSIMSIKIDLMHFRKVIRELHNPKAMRLMEYFTKGSVNAILFKTSVQWIVYYALNNHLGNSTILFLLTFKAFGPWRPLYSDSQSARVILYIIFTNPPTSEWTKWNKLIFLFTTTVIPSFFCRHRIGFSYFLSDIR